MAGVPATSANFFDDEELDPNVLSGAAPAAATGYVPGAAAAKAKLTADATNTANSNIANYDRNASIAVDPTQQAAAYQSGNIGGSAGAYNMTSDAGRAGFDMMHDVTRDTGLNAVDALRNNTLGAAGFDDWNSAVAGIGKTANSAVNTATGGAGFQGAVQGVNNTVNLPTGGAGFQGVVDNINAAGKAAGEGDLAGVIGGITGIDVPSMDMGGADGGNIPIDASGADRGGMARDYTNDLSRVQGKADSSQALGRDVLSGAAAPGGQGQQGQQDALDAAMSFAGGPRAATGVMSELGAFNGKAGPSEAELLLQQASQGGMADALSLARSGRARDAGSQARMMNQALAENAATGVDTARNVGLLRAKEASDAKAQQLQALGLKGNLAQGVDQGTLGALGLQGDIASALRSGNIQERGQGLQFTQGMEGIGAGLESDALKTIPQFENIRHEDQFDLTPQQKLAAAKLGGTPDKTTADYVTGLLGDVLSAL